MKLVISALVALVATPRAAQTTPAPAAAPMATATPTPAGGARFTLDTPLETIAADPAGKAVLDADLDTITAKDFWEQIKSLSLTGLQPMAGDRLPDTLLAKVKADLAALK